MVGGSAVGGSTSWLLGAALVCAGAGCSAPTPDSAPGPGPAPRTLGSAVRGSPSGRPFEILERWRLPSPHQVAFGLDDSTALVACAGSDEVAVLDLDAGRVRDRLRGTGTPIGVGVAGDSGDELVLIARYAQSQVEARPLVRGGPRAGSRHEVGAGPGVLVGPLPGGRFLVAAERGNRLSVLETDPRPSVLTGIATGSLPGTPAVTADGGRAFVPCLAPERQGALRPEGQIQVFDLRGGRALPPLFLEGFSRACALWPGDRLLGATETESDRVAWLDLERRQMLGHTQLAPGDRPTAIAVDPVAELAFVACSGSAAVVVLGREAEQPGVVRRIQVGQRPTFLVVAPHARELWVACQDSDEVLVLALPSSVVAVTE